MGQNEQAFEEQDHYGTPAEVLDPIVAAFGGIGLDPFWNPQSLVKAKTRWTDWTWGSSLPSEAFSDVEWGVDSFERSWDGFGLVFLNGPFSEMARWLEKGAKEGDEVIILMKANMNATYLHQWFRPCDRIHIPDHRYKFIGAEHQAPFHCMLGYWGSRPHLFEKAFPGWTFPGDVRADAGEVVRDKALRERAAHVHGQ